MVWASGDRDLEVIPIGHDALEPRARTSHWSARRVRLALVATALLASVGLAISGLSVRTHHARAAPTPRPTAEGINARLSVQRSEVIVVVGDKIIARPIRNSNGTGPLGLVHLAAPAGVPTAVLAVEGMTVVAQGTDESGDSRTGTWGYRIGAGRPVFLGSSTGFVPSADVEETWLTTGAAVRRVSVATGATVDGPYPAEGRLVASIGGGLLLQRGIRVVWWVPGAPGESRLVGIGTALGGLGDYILWQGSGGRITVTDHNIGHATVTALTVRRDHALGPAAMSPNRVRVAIAIGTTVSIGDMTRDGHVVSVHLGPV